MDIYSFINSRDVAEHCRKLGHKFDARDAAFLVHENKFMDISEKHRAYEEIMTRLHSEYAETAIYGGKPLINFSCAIPS